MYGFVIAMILCGGNNCDMVQADPDISYPSYAACDQALTAKATALQATADKQAGKDRQARIVCLHALNTIVEVEEPHDVLDTAIVHQEPSASSLFVGLVESGKRTLVTGLVAGTGWVRVLLPDGKTGYVYADHLRRVLERPRTASLTAPPATSPGAVVAANPDAAAPSVTPPTASASSSPEPRPAAPHPPPAPSAMPSPPTQQALVLPPPPPPSAAPPGAAGPAGFRDCPTCPEMVPVPAGSFEMGSNEDYSERPPHRVTIPAFALGRFEVTVAEWDACADAGACAYKPPAEPSATRRPMTNLSWNDAEQYVQWLRKTTGKPYRLPSEAEWEYAAAAGHTTAYPWGEQAGIGKADCRGCGGNYDEHRPADIGTFAANPWGLHDMLGGVAEWVEDCWHLSYQAAPANGSAWTSHYCPKHVLRGGSWMNPPSDITVRVRNFYDTGVRYIGNGMRVALSLH